MRRRPWGVIAFGEARRASFAAGFCPCLFDVDERDADWSATVHPEYFVGQTPFLERMAALVEEMHDTPAAARHTSVRVPGERRHRERLRRSRRGIPISDDVWADLAELSDRHGIPLPEVWGSE